MAQKKKKGIKEFYKNNRIYCILMIVSIIGVITIGVSVILHFVNQSNKNVYGTRLNNVDDHKVKDDLKNLENYYKEIKEVKTVSIRLQGKIIYVDVMVDPELSNTQIESIAVAGLDKIAEENLKFYDMNYIFVRDSEVPYLGYKNANNNGITWAHYNVTTTTAVTTTTKKGKN